MSIYASWQRLALPTVLAATVGCGEAETISTYEVERTAPPVANVDAQAVAGELDHMLTAIVPQDDQAWFFKLVATGSQIEPLRKPFEEFVASVDVSGGKDKPAWKLPAGWAEKPGDAMRAATIEVPAGDDKLQLTVSSLPLSGDWADYVERNVNRWMNQLQQPPLTGKTIADLARTSATQAGGEATIIELRGVMDRTATPGMMPPGHPPVDASASADGTPPTGTTAGAPAPRAPGAPADQPAAPIPPSAAEFAKPREFTYSPPAGWQPGRSGGMRTAAFNIVEDGKSAEVTVMPFPPVAQMTDPHAQIDRWAGEVNLNVTEEQYDDLMSDAQIDGVDGYKFELFGPDGTQALGTLAAMVTRSDKVWFFKMKGDRSLVESQREAFDKFLESIKFTDEAR